MFGRLLVIFLLSPVIATAHSVAPVSAQSLGRCDAFLEVKSWPANLNSQQVSKSEKEVLNRVLGQVELHFQGRGKLVANFTPEIDHASRSRAGDGDILIETLMPLLDVTSPTSMRVEEKAVIPSERVNEFLTRTQSTEFAEKYNEGQRLHWAPRDLPQAGHKFVTITEYGKHLTYSLPASASTFVVKPRYRKYYDFPEHSRDQIDSYTSALGSLVAFELKITSLSGPDSDLFLAVPNTVFKPRIFLSDALADRLKQINADSDTYRDDLTQIENEVLALKTPDNQPLNRLDHVESVFKALQHLLSKDPHFLQPTFVVKYERSSYRMNLDKREYQFTSDQNVGIYLPIRGLKSDDMQLYLNQQAVFKSNDNESFVELKSPVSEKRWGSPLYRSMISWLEQHHVVAYRKGSGKYAIAKFVDQGVLGKNIDRTLLDQGVFFWLIKGTANLDSPPKKNDLLARGEVEVTFPFAVKDGRTFRIMFRYRGSNRYNGFRHSYLDRIRILDDRGSEIKVQPGFDDLIGRSYNLESDEIAGLNVDGKIIPFKLRILNSELQEYRRFFSNFYAYSETLRGNGRNLDVLDGVTDRKGLQRYARRLKAENVVHFIVERTKRVALGAAITLAALGGYDYLRSPPTATAVNAPFQSSSVRDNFQAWVLKGLRTTDHGAIDLFVEPHRAVNGEFVFSIINEQEYNFSDSQFVDTYDSNGNVLRFIVKRSPAGKIEMHFKEMNTGYNL